MNVLLAEDNPVNQEIAAGLLEVLGCSVTVVENGRQAVDAARGGPFDLVLMDCEMPVMDGLEAARSIRESGAGSRRLPIIALTAKDAEEAEGACLAAGMDGLLGKPFSRADLASLIERWRPSPNPTCHAPSQSSTAQPNIAAPDAAAEAETTALDPAPIEALRSLDPGGERQLIQRAITKFADYSDELVARLGKAVGDKNSSEVARLAHSLKSSSANLGATNLASQCAEIERHTKNGELPEDIGQRLTALQAAQGAARQQLLKLVGAA
ncbi:MAG: response regulator [Alphaproteobacteria bacterium]